MKAHAIGLNFLFIMTVSQNSKRYIQLLFGAFVLIWTLLALNPVYRFDWFLENILVFAFVPLLLYFYKKSPFSNLSYTLIFIFLVLHSIGAHYTYSEVPAGKIVSAWLGFERNQYDRAVHFLWGLLLTMPVFEIIRKKIRHKEKIVFLFSCSIIVMTGVVYELLEWAAASIVAPAAGTAFLGTQGDEWDAQKDLLLNLSGSMVSIVFLSFIIHQKQHNHVNQ